MNSSNYRKTKFAGEWYPDDIKNIKKYISEMEKRDVLGAVVPHAGWMYSGKIAGMVFSSIKSVDSFIIIAPNHHGLGEPLSIWSKGKWNTPIGDIEIDEEISKLIMNLNPNLIFDIQSHIEEHSIEVQTPFIKVLFDNAKILPISMADYRLTVCERLGRTISEVVKNSTKKIVVVASTDMSHYVPQRVAEKYDKMAIEKILQINPEGLWKVVEENDISMCGLGPIVSMLYAVNLLKFNKAKLLKYTTSAEITFDTSSVVGYAGIIIE